MKTAYRKSLFLLVNKHSTKICNSPGRCEALMRDFCGRESLELNLLITALKGGIPEEMLSLGNRSLQYILLNMPMKLIHNNGLSKKNARWAIESWAIALGIATEKDIRAFYTNEVRLKKHTSEGVLSSRFNGFEFMRFPQGRYKIGSIKSLPNRNSIPDIEFEEFFISKHPINHNRWLIFRDDSVLVKKNGSSLGHGSGSFVQAFIYKIKSLYLKFRFISQFV